MKNKFLFDVDGTLTPSREVISDDFKYMFLEFCNNNSVYLVTGSDYHKTLEQLGETICHAVEGVYCCSGNEYLENSKILHTNDWKPCDDLMEFFHGEMERSQFSERSGNHVEMRNGCVNFSIVGRNASQEQRSLYVQWDKSCDERKSIAKRMTRSFPDLMAFVGGDTGIDVYPRGYDKSQVLQHFTDYNVIFFGDAIYEGGNDYSIAQANTNGTNHKVYSWVDTMGIIQENYL